MTIHVICFVFSEYEMSKGHMIVIVVLSTLMGITWLWMIAYVIFLKQRWNLQRTDKREDKGQQPETQRREHHYDDLQDTDVDQFEKYTVLDSTNQETPYEETL